jgi:hypothetical protein
MTGRLPSPQHNLNGLRGASAHAAVAPEPNSRIVNFIWGIADDVLRDLYVRGKRTPASRPTTVPWRALMDSVDNGVAPGADG